MCIKVINIIKSGHKNRNMVHFESSRTIHLVAHICCCPSESTYHGPMFYQSNLSNGFNKQLTVKHMNYLLINYFSSDFFRK